MTGPLRAKEPGSSASPELRAVLQHAHASVPSRAQVTALTAAVLSQLPHASTASATSAASRGVSIGTAGKWLVVGLATSLAGAGWLALRAPLDKPSDAPAAPRQLEQRPSSPTAMPTLPLPTPLAPPDSDSDSDLVPPATAQRARSKPARAARPAPLPQAEHELELLIAARRARHETPAAALALLEEHAQLFPNSALSEEREAMTIALLQRLDPGRAATRLRDFQARYPHSAYRPGLEALER